LPTFQFDGKTYDTDEISEDAKRTIASLGFIEERIQQKRNELAIADTARIAYTRALKRQMARAVEADEESEA